MSIRFNIPRMKRMESNLDSDNGNNGNNNNNEESSAKETFKLSFGSPYQRNTPPHGNMNPHHYRHMMHRPSVRSISETPNVIGAQTSQYQSDLCSFLLAGLSWFLVVLFFPLSIAFIFRVVQEYERGN